MDLSKLPPAPWKAGYREGFYYASAHGDFPLLIPESDDDEGKAAIDFSCVARNAFDVMMRRGWTAKRRENGWAVYDVWIPLPSDPAHWADPFTALVEADKWYRENVELTPPSSPPPIAPGTTPSTSPTA